MGQSFEWQYTCRKINLFIKYNKEELYVNSQGVEDNVWVECKNDIIDECMHALK